MTPQQLYAVSHGSEPETHSEKFKVFCEMLHWVKKKNTTMLEKRFNSGSFDKDEARKLWRKIHK